LKAIVTHRSVYLFDFLGKEKKFLTFQRLGNRLREIEPELPFEIQVK